MATVRTRSGTVSSFDDDSGLGVVRDGSDGTESDFHCTAIVDGSRHIEVGARVSFELRAGHAGRLEAALITPLT